MKGLKEREHENSTRKRLDADRVRENAALKDPIETTLSPVERREAVIDVVSVGGLPVTRACHA